MLKCDWCGDKFELSDWEKEVNAKHPEQGLETLCSSCWLISRFQDHIARTIEKSEIFANRIINMLVAKGRLESYTKPGDDELTSVIFLEDIHLGAHQQEHELFAKHADEIIFVDDWAGY